MTLRTWAAFLALCLIWGTPYFFIKTAVVELSPVWVAWGRLVFGSIVLLPMAWHRGAFKNISKHRGADHRVRARRARGPVLSHCARREVGELLTRRHSAGSGAAGGGDHLANDGRARARGSAAAARPRRGARRCGRIAGHRYLARHAPVARGCVHPRRNDRLCVGAADHPTALAGYGFPGRGGRERRHRRGRAHCAGHVLRAIGHAFAVTRSPPSSFWA